MNTHTVKTQLNQPNKDVGISFNEKLSEEVLCKLAIFEFTAADKIISDSLSNEEITDILLMKKTSSIDLYGKCVELVLKRFVANLIKESFNLKKIK